MARLTQDTKDKILADFHTGYFSQRDLALKYECSTATINKLTKGLKPEHKDKVNTLITIKSQLAEESEQKVNAIETIVEEKTKHLIYFRESALKNQELANRLLEGTDKLKDVESHSRITKTNKETVLGKDPDTIINNQNNNQNNIVLDWDLI